MSRNIFVIQPLDGMNLSSEHRSIEMSECDTLSLSTSQQRSLHCTIRRRQWILAATFVVLTVLGFAFRAAYLQIVRGSYYAILSEHNRARIVVLPAARGTILDRFGIELVQNVPSFVLTMRITDLPKEEQQRDVVLWKVANLAGMNRTDLDLLISDYAEVLYDPIPIKRNISYESAIKLSIESAELPGFALEALSQRRYPSSIQSLSHILGYMGKISPSELPTKLGEGYRSIDNIGITGVEAKAEKVLRGTPGFIRTEVDARGRERSTVTKQDPIAGENIHLTVDSLFQKFVETRLQETLKVNHVQRGSVVAMDPRTGEILALVSLPTFDSNLFAAGIEQIDYEQLLNNTDQPLFPRAIAGTFPSGSTFKPFIAYAALVENIISEHTSFLSTGGVNIGEWFFPDWKAGGHGVTDVRKAIAESVNTFFYIIGGGLDSVTGLGVERITNYAKVFGFGSSTGIDLPAEAAGFLPSKEWKEKTKKERWYVGDTYHLAIGQGDLLVTPLQMATATARLANGGVKITPHVISQKIDVDSIPRIDPYSDNAMRIVREGMRQTVTTGSARSLQGLPFSVAGKTGTAQTPGDRPTHAWFTGFAPYTDPTIALTVLIEEGGEGSSVAVPLAREIFQQWYLLDNSSVPR